MCGLWESARSAPDARTARTTRQRRFNLAPGTGARTAATGEDLSTLDPSVAAARRSQARAAAREGVSQETLRRAAELETESRGGDVLAGTRWTQGRIVSAC